MPMEKKRSPIGIYGIAPIALIQDKRITRNELRMYIILSSFQGCNDRAFPSLPEIAKRAYGKSWETKITRISEYISGLVKKGWVEKKRRYGRSNVYVCLFDTEFVSLPENMDIRENMDFPESLEDDFPESLEDDFPESLEDIKKRTIENNIVKKHEEQVLKISERIKFGIRGNAYTKVMSSFTGNEDDKEIFVNLDSSLHKRVSGYFPNAIFRVAK